MTFPLSFKVAKLLRNGCNDNNFPMVHTICNAIVKCPMDSLPQQSFIHFRLKMKRNSSEFLPTSLNARPF